MKIKFLTRERINHVLSAIFDYPLTIVEAPMGFGKTTAVRSFLESKKIKSLWITLQEAEESEAFFWDKFASEISRVDKMRGQALKSLGFPLDAPQTDKVIEILNSIHFREKTVIVLDDYHLVKSKPLNKMISQIVSEKLEHFYIVIITRDTTDLNLSELISKGLCEVISQQVLKFTDNEINEYCLMMTKHISEQDLKKLREYTDGWISLIYMLLIGLEKGIPVGMSMTIDELIKKTLFEVYDQPVQDFLMKLSIMDYFTTQQAEFVLGSQSASQMLDKLQKENAFVYYDETNKTYKIHNVLLDFLRLNQNLSDEELKTLYRHLGEWYLNQTAFLRAYSCFNRAGDTERILEHLNHPENIRNELTEFEGSFEMFKKTPKELLHKYPIAYLQHILLYLLRGNEQAVIECIKQLNELQQVYIQMEGISDTYRNRILAEICIIRKFTAFNYMDKSTTDNDLILKLLNGEHSYIMQRDNEFTFGSPHLIYNYFREQGRLKETLELIVNKFPVYPMYANGCGTGAEYLALAEYGLETGDFESAELNSQKAVYKAQTKEQHSIIICARFTLIRLYILRGRIDEGIEMLKQLEKDIRPVNNSIYNTTVDICKGYIYANLGLAERIPYWLQIGDMTTADLFYQGIAFNYLVYGKAVTASKNYVKLEVLAESFNEYFSLYSNQIGFIHNGIFDAVAKYQLYGMSEGIKALTSALDKGEADHIIMPFVENAPYIIKMLNQMESSYSDNDYFKSVIKYSQQYIESVKRIQLPKTMLTQREREVLTLCAEGLKREDVASRLFMSESTVKRHLQNIYQKLEVSGKIAAINTAKKNGLI